MSTMRYIIRARLKANGTRLRELKETMRSMRGGLRVVVTPAEYEMVGGQRRKVMPAQGPTPAGCAKDLATSLFLAKIKAAKKMADKLEFVKQQKTNRIISFLRTGR